MCNACKIVDSGLVDDEAAQQLAMTAGRAMFNRSREFVRLATTTAQKHPGLAEDNDSDDVIVAWVALVDILIQKSSTELAPALAAAVIELGFATRGGDAPVSPDYRPGQYL